jgi:hypothetical protein
MNANVRCTRVFIAADGTPFATPRKCGWKGERAKTWDAPTGYEVAATRKPCPRCGGQVELIPERV